MEVLISILRFVGTIFLVLMIFNLMIIVHEWGHFLAGRWRGLYIDRFQIWFGKPLWKKTYNGVQYGLGSIPAGGFVSLPQMAPMESIEGEVKDEDGNKKELPPISPLDKIIVAAAGPLFSFLLALFFAVIVWGVKKPVSEADATTVIGYVQEDSPAEKAGIQVGDKITFIDGNKVERFRGMNNSVTWSIITSEGESIEVIVDRPGKGEMTLQVEHPNAKEEKIEGNWLKQTWAYVSRRTPLPKIGVGPQWSAVVGEFQKDGPAEKSGLKTGDVVVAINHEPISSIADVDERTYGENVTYQLKVTRGNKELDFDIVARTPEINGTKPSLGFQWQYGGIRTLVRENPLTQVTNSFKSIVNTLQAVFSPKSSVNASHLNGPVGIMGLYYDLFQHPDGWRLMLWFSVLLNVNLAILNMLPFPVLDGGHIVMAIVEWIRKRPVPIKFLEVVQGGFVILLLGFMAFVTLKDVGDRVPKGSAKEQKDPQFLPLKTDSE